MCVERGHIIRKDDGVNPSTAFPLQPVETREQKPGIDVPTPKCGKHEAVIDVAFVFTRRYLDPAASVDFGLAAEPAVAAGPSRGQGEKPSPAALETGSEIRDSLAALLSRYDGGYFKPVASLDSPYLARQQLPDSRSDSPVSRNSSFLGRAPPASLVVL